MSLKKILGDLVSKLWIQFVYIKVTHDTRHMTREEENTLEVLPHSKGHPEKKSLLVWFFQKWWEGVVPESKLVKELLVVACVWTFLFIYA